MSDLASMNRAYLVARAEEAAEKIEHDRAAAQRWQATRDAALGGNRAHIDAEHIAANVLITADKGEKMHFTDYHKDWSGVTQQAYLQTLRTLFADLDLDEEHDGDNPIGITISWI